MDRSVARYPFRDAAREAVREVAPSIDRLVDAEGPSAVVERAKDRVERALTGETTGPTHPDPEVELLSYPIARVIVSLVDDPLVIDRYVRAEANTAVERFRADRDADRSDGLDERDLLTELDVEFRERDGRVGIDRVTYLRLAPDLDGDDWRLVNRPLADGWVALDRGELDDVLGAAVRDRVGRDLPLAVPEDLAEGLSEVVSAVEERLGHPTLPAEFEAVDPARFPPCMQALLERVHAGDRLAPRSRYALASFLTSIGVASDELGSVLETSVPDELAGMAAAVEGGEGPTQFPPGSCRTMVVYGDCVDPDGLCDRIDNPLEYYGRRLEGETP